MPIKRYPEALMPGQWIPSANTRSGFDWDPSAPDPDPSPTSILPTYSTGVPQSRHVLRQEATMTDQTGGELVSFDPDDPHDPAMADLDSLDRAPLTDPVQPDITVCPTCGTAVSRDRLR